MNKNKYIKRIEVIDGSIEVILSDDSVLVGIKNYKVQGGIDDATEVTLRLLVIREKI